MEDILASIRRIIADDQEGMRASPERTSSASSPLKNVLEMTESRMAPLTLAEEGDVMADHDALDLGPEGADEDDAYERIITAESRLYEPERAAAAVSAYDEPHEYDELQIEALPEGVEALGEAELPAEDLPESAAFRVRQAAQEQDELLSGAAGAAVAGAFDRLDATISARPARSMEDVVTEMLRPLLREWLNRNLPPIVERLVRAEIERVTRGRR